MMAIRQLVSCAAVVVGIAMAPVTSDAQTVNDRSDAPVKYVPNVPEKITTPDTIETRSDTLRFRDGAPDSATVRSA